MYGHVASKSILCFSGEARSFLNFLASVLEVITLFATVRCKREGILVKNPSYFLIFTLDAYFWNIKLKNLYLISIFFGQDNTFTYVNWHGVGAQIFIR
jgi:hypothetical protein